MYLKRKATVLISTVIMLSLMSLLGCLMFKMMRNNNEMGNLYNFHKDRYDLDKGEEEILYKFMKKLNENRNKGEKGSNGEEDKFPKDVDMEIGDSTFYYDEKKNELVLKTNKDNENYRERDIIYFFRNEKIILVPTHKFKDKYE